MTFHPELSAATGGSPILDLHCFEALTLRAGPMSDDADEDEDDLDEDDDLTGDEDMDDEDDMMASSL